MSPLYNFGWLVLLMPLLGCLASFLFETPRRAAHAVIGCNLLGFASSLFILIFRLAHRHDGPSDGLFVLFQTNPEAASNGNLLPPTLEPQLGLRVDNFSASFSAVILFIAVVVLWHATSSMRNDAAYRRIFWCSSLLVTGVIGLAMAPSLFQALFAFMLTSAATFVLASHWWENPDVARGAQRSFIWMAVADLALMLAVITTWTRLGSEAASETTTGGGTFNDPFDFNFLAGEVNRVSTHLVAGVGGRTLALIAILIVVAAFIRGAVLPSTVWLSSLSEAPLPAIGLVLSVGIGSGVLLLAKSWPFLLAVPHLMSVLAVIAVISAIVCAVVACYLRDIAHICAWLCAAQLGIVFCIQGTGGYSASLQAMFMLLLTTPILVLACGNLVRGYRTRNIIEMGGAWRRMPHTSFVLAAWLVLVAGVNLVSFNAINSAWNNSFDDLLATHGHLNGTVRVVLLAGLFVALSLIAVAAARLFVRTCIGHIAVRRGFSADRLRDVERRATITPALLVAGALLALAAGIPSAIKNLTFDHFVFYGLTGHALQVPSVNASAVVAALAIAVVAAGSTWWFAQQTREVESRSLLGKLAGYQLGIEAALAHAVHRVATDVGRIIAIAEADVIGGITSAANHGLDSLGEVALRTKTARLSSQLRAAVVIAAAAVAVAAAVAGGHH